MKDKNLDLFEELFSRYGNKGKKRLQWLYYRKKYTWIFIVDGAQLIKRLFDVVISFCLLILLVPLFLLISIAIKLTDGGDIFYFSTRVGKWGKEFILPKFRSMEMFADQKKSEILKDNQHISNKTFKIKKDPRVTLLGKVLRKLSLDELPQLWNVLKGEMSLVGPRPPLPEEVATYSLDDRRRLDGIPGLTCIWQVSGRSNIPFPQQVKLDIKYIENQSFLLDIKLLLATIPAILFGKGAY